jgi:hypothetical protein
VKAPHARWRALFGFSAFIAQLSVMYGKLRIAVARSL